MNNDTPAEWIYWTPERDGHAPDDWVEKQPVEYLSGGAAWLLAASPQWNAYIEYRYRPLRMELKPCPFCGGEAQRFTLTEEDEPMNAGGDVITCTKCQASSHVEFGRKEKLVECWNTRTTSLAAQDGLVERIVRDVAELPDRTSPEDWPDAMLVTADELAAIVEAALASIEVKS